MNSALSRLGLFVLYFLTMRVNRVNELKKREVENTANRRQRLGLCTGTR